MKLHELTSIKSRRSQRIGRGGKRGHTAGRGTKGQHSRSGRRIRPAERDLILRIPKLRGFRNKQKAEDALIVNLATLETKLKHLMKGNAPFELNMTSLRSAKMIRKHFNGEVKILGTGNLTFPISVSGISVSASAKKKIEQAGGSVEASH